MQQNLCTCTPYLCLYLCPMQVREYLEKHYAETAGKETIKLALKSLMETVEPGSKNVEVRHDSQAGVSSGTLLKVVWRLTSGPEC